LKYNLIKKNIIIYEYIYIIYIRYCSGDNMYMGNEKCIFRCGPGIGKCQDGQCCSKKGYCGTTSEFCSLSLGCQSSYGKCEK